MFRHASSGHAERDADDVARLRRRRAVGQEPRWYAV